VNIQEILAQIDRAVTEIDLVLHQWQEDLDMMSFIGSNATFELWTNDIPPRLVTKDVLGQAAGKELRVMNYLDGEPRQVGTAVIDENGTIKATLTEDVPQLKMHSLKGVSIRQDQLEDPGSMFSFLYSKPAFTAMAHYTMHEDGSVTDNYTGKQIAFSRAERKWNISEKVREAIDNVERNYEFKHRSDLDNKE
jgi:hypothetical protein